MRWELYLARREWQEIKLAVRERATVPGEKKPRCENPKCRAVHGRLKKNPQGYWVPQWLHTAHKHDAPMKSRDIRDYLALCPSCHMAYDRQPNEDGVVAPYRVGYRATSTDELVREVRDAGLMLRESDDHYWHWQIGDLGGYAESPALAIGACIATLGRLVEPYV